MYQRCPALSVRFILSLAVVFTSAVAAFADPLVGFQGRLQVAGTNFNGPARFKFAIVSGTPGVAVWSNAPDANSDGEPDSAIDLTLERGVFALSLGDTTIDGMASLAGVDFGSGNLAVRVWFSTGTNAFTRLLPDQPFSTVGHALRASSVDGGAIRFETLSPEVRGRIGRLETGYLSLTNQQSELDQLRSRFDSLLTEVDGLRASLNAVSNSVPRSMVAASQEADDVDLLERGYLRFRSLPAPPWVNLGGAEVPSARSGHTMVWSGSEAIIWGGLLGIGTVSANGATYEPTSGLWRPLSTLGAPAARAGAASALSSTGLLLWGGFAGGTFLNSGAILSLGTYQWTDISTNGAPEPRDNHVAAWTGSRFLVWGGRSEGGLFGNGGSYDPLSRGWLTLPINGAPSARSDPMAVWTGTSWIVWGGTDHSGELDTGARLLADTNGVPQAWTPMSRTGAPSPRTAACVVWTGRRMLVWGGRSDTVLGDGAAYDPVNDTWTPLSAVDAPTPRSGAMVVWTGFEMIVFGGRGALGPLADGAAYDPSTGRWRPLTNGGAPVARADAGAVWTGNELVVFGGLGASGPLAAPQQVEPRPTWYLYRKP